MIKFTYFWILIIFSMGLFFIGLYRNIVLKIVHILWINHPEMAGPVFRDTRIALPMPDKKTIIQEVLLQNRIKNRSTFLWLRHVMIFLGFVSIFLFDQLYTLVVKLIPMGFFIEGGGRAFLKFGLELSGTILLIGLVLGFCHTYFNAKSENRYVDIRLIVLLLVVVITGFLTETFRFVVEPNDAFMGYSFLAGPMSKLFAYLPLPWEVMAPGMWIIHASVTAAFFATIPYSKFVHIFAAPIGRSIALSDDIGKLKRENISKGMF